MLPVEKSYICCDMKSFYASVECVARGLDPLQARLLVADESRSDKTICLAVSPALKAMGVPSRPRLFEARQSCCVPAEAMCALRRITVFPESVLHSSRRMNATSCRSGSKRK